MNSLPEPDGIDLTIGSDAPGSRETPETLRLIAELKQTARHRAESAEAERILSALGIPLCRNASQTVGTSVARIDHSEGSAQRS